MRRVTKTALTIAVVFLFIGAWLVHFHTALFADHLPKWAWLQSSLAALGEAPPEPEPDEDPDNTKNEIPIHVAKVTTATLHQYVEGFGTVSPRLARGPDPAGSAAISAPVAGVVSKIAAQVGEHVHAGQLLIQLDDRVAKSAEDSAQAGVGQAEASLRALLGTPRPEQIEIAQLALQKAQNTVEFAQKNYDRTQQLSAAQGVAAKTVEQAGNDLASAKNDLSTAQLQMRILKNTPSPEDVAQEKAKVAQAAASLASARVQRQVLGIVSPIDATVASLSVNPGEAVDPTKVIVQLVALDRLSVAVSLPADQLPEKADALPAQVLLGRKGDDNVVSTKVSSISPQIDARNGAVSVAVDLPSDTTLKLGQTVRVRLITAEHKDCLAVPRSAVVSDENGDSVISVVDKEQATHKSVQVGIEEDDLVEIIADGITEGTTVATAGAFGLPQASHVKVVP